MFFACLRRVTIISAYIINFQAPKEFEDLEDRYYRDRMTNIDHIFSWHDTLGEWTVDKDSTIGDEVFFMRAVTSVQHMAHLCKIAKETKDTDFIQFTEQERALYRKYAGTIVARGVISDYPFQTETSGYAFPAWRSPWYARIGQSQVLQKPIHISQFRDFIKVSRTGSITKLTLEQQSALKKLVQENGL